MEYLKVAEAAQRLNVSPPTLRAWEQRFGFPIPERSPGGHRLYRHIDIASLREALQQGLSIAAAVARVRAGDTYDAQALAAPLCEFDIDRVARTAEGALAVRSLERVVDEVVLPALELVDARHGLASAEWAFASGWACEWLRWTRRLSTRGARRVPLLIADATRPGAPDAIRLRALELYSVRAGANLLTLPLHATRGLDAAADRLRPAALLIAGAGGSERDVDAFVRAVTRRTARPLARWLRPAPGTAGATGAAGAPGTAGAAGAPDTADATDVTGAWTLPDAPLAAHRQLLLLAAGESPELAGEATGPLPARDTG